jgi:hypothetical protein
MSPPKNMSKCYRDCEIRTRAETEQVQAARIRPEALGQTKDFLNDVSFSELRRRPPLGARSPHFEPAGPKAGEHEAWRAAL